MSSNMSGYERAGEKRRPEIRFPSTSAKTGSVGEAELARTMAAVKHSQAQLADHLLHRQQSARPDTAASRSSENEDVWKRERALLQRRLGSLETKLEMERNARETIEESYLNMSNSRRSGSVRKGPSVVDMNTWGGPSSVKGSRLKDLEDELRQMQVQASEAEHERDRAKQKTKEMERKAMENMTDLARQRDEADARLSSALKEVKQLNHSIEELQITCTRLSDSADEAQRQAKLEQEKRSLVDQENYRLRDALDEARQKVSETRGEKDNIEENISRAKERIRVLEVAEKGYEQQLTMERTLNDDLKRRARGSEEECARLRAEALELRRVSELRELEARDRESDVNAERGMQDRTATQMELALNRAKSDLAEARTEIRDLRKDLALQREQFDRENRDLRERQRIALEEHSRIADDRRVAGDRVAIAERQVLILQQQNIALEEKVASASGEKSAAIEHAKHLNNELSSLRDQCQRKTEMESELRRLRDQCNELASIQATERERLMADHRSDIQRATAERDRLVSDHRLELDRILHEAARERDRGHNAEVVTLSKQIEAERYQFAADMAVQKQHYETEILKLTNELVREREANEVERESFQAESALQEQCEQLEMALEARISEIRKLKEEVSQQQQTADEVEKYKQRALEYRKRELSLAAELTQTVAALDERADMRRSTNVSFVDNDSHRSEILQLKSANSELEQQLNAAQRDAENLKLRLERANRDREHAEQDLSRARRAAMDQASEGPLRERFAALVSALTTCVGLVNRQTESARKTMRFTASMSLTPHSTATHTKEDHEAVVDALASVRRIVTAASTDLDPVRNTAGWRDEYNFCLPILKVVEHGRAETATLLQKLESSTDPKEMEIRSRLVELDQHILLLSNLLSRVVSFASAQRSFASRSNVGSPRTPQNVNVL